MRMLCVVVAVRGADVVNVSLCRCGLLPAKLFKTNRHTAAVVGVVDLR